MRRTAIDRLCLKPTTLVVRLNFVTDAAPVPESCAINPPPLASLSLTESVAARAPLARGIKVIVIEHIEPAGIGAVVHVFVSPKSAGFEPAMANPLITSGAPAELAF